jgi:uncharacterized membrane protein (UPF0182 family)
VHLSLLEAAWLAVQAWSYLLRRWALLYERSAILSRPGYAAVNALLPGYQILAGLMVLGISSLLANRPSGAGRGLGRAGRLAGRQRHSDRDLPGLVERFVVTPSQLALEQQYLARHRLRARPTGSTRSGGRVRGPGRDHGERGPVGFGDDREHPPVGLPPAAGHLQPDQEIRRYYEFRDVDVEAYTSAASCARSCWRPADRRGPAAEETRTWLNQHLIYTTATAWPTR